MAKKQVIFRYIREGVDGDPFKGKRIGVVAAVGPGIVGWSKLDPHDITRNPIERKAALGLAVARALMPDLQEIAGQLPHSIKADVERFKETSVKYFT